MKTLERKKHFLYDKEHFIRILCDTKMTTFKEHALLRIWLRTNLVGTSLPPAVNDHERLFHFKQVMLHFDVKSM